MITFCSKSSYFKSQEAMMFIFIDSRTCEVARKLITSASSSIKEELPVLPSFLQLSSSNSSVKIVESEDFVLVRIVKSRETSKPTIINKNRNGNTILTIFFILVAKLAI